MPMFTSFHRLFPEHTQQAYKDGLYTDLKIICGKNEFKVHKIIVSQSRVIEKMLSGHFRESSTNTIDLTVDGISYVSRLIHCLYYGAYADYDATVDPEEWNSAHHLHAAMYALGDMYDFTVFKDKAKWNFDLLVSKKPQDLLNLIQSIPIVYESTPNSDRGLRDIVIRRVMLAPSDLLHEKVESAFRKAVVEVSDFSLDLHLRWMVTFRSKRD